MHGHYGYSRRFHNVFFVLRDGRDVMVSLYYYLLFPNEINHHPTVERIRKRLAFPDYEDIGTNLPKFIEFVFTEHDRRPFHHTWDELALQWYHQKAPAVVRYEDLLQDCTGTMARAIEKITTEQVDSKRLWEICDQLSFAKLAKRPVGTENIRSFLRKGISGDWKNKFSQDAKKVFHEFAGRALVELGYEKDSDWVA
jgi:hypothetical protein